MSSFESLPFFRGISAKYEVDQPFIKTMRKDRRPRDTDLEVHLAADNWFYERFGIRFRSEAVFLTPIQFIASQYAATPAHVVRIIPLGHYQYCWSRKAVDMLLMVKGASTSLEVGRILDGCDYSDRGLEEAARSGNELMLFCEKYICIPVGLLHDSSSISSEGSLLIL